MISTYFIIQCYPAVLVKDIEEVVLSHKISTSIKWCPNLTCILSPFFYISSFKVEFVVSEKLQLKSKR